MRKILLIAFSLTAIFALTQMKGKKYDYTHRDSEAPRSNPSQVEEPPTPEASPKEPTHRLPDPIEKFIGSLWNTDPMAYWWGEPKEKPDPQKQSESPVPCYADSAWDYVMQMGANQDSLSSGFVRTMVMPYRIIYPDTLAMMKEYTAIGDTLRNGDWDGKWFHQLDNWKYFRNTKAGQSYNPFVMNIKLTNEDCYLKIFVDESGDISYMTYSEQ